MKGLRKKMLMNSAWGKVMEGLDFTIEGNN